MSASLWLALAVSMAALIALCLGDPKRRRAAGRRGHQSPSTRRYLMLAAALPGAMLALSGDAAAFLAWLGAAAVSGWLITLTCAGRPRA